MARRLTTSILFTGYAPVHFLCFRPLYERLCALHGVEVFVSGGLRTATPNGFVYDTAALFRPFGIPEHRMLAVEDLPHRRFDVLYCANKRIIAPPENFGAKIQIFHGVSFRNRGVRPENLAYDFLFLIGPYMHRKFVETGMLSANDPRAVAIGFPKTDPLLDGSLDRRAIRASHGWTGERPVLLYAPTGEAYNSLETIGIEMIQRLQASARYDLLIKPHDHPKNADIDWYTRLARYEDAHTRLVRECDVIPLLAAADLLITDASSVANEFALLDRPIVFLDVPELLRRSREAGAQLDLVTWGRRGGVLVERPAEIEDAVASSLARPDCQAGIRAEITRDLFYNPGRATDAALAWFSSKFLSRPAVPVDRRPAATGARASSRGLRKRRRQTIAYYLRHCGNLHYFAALKPYLDHLLHSSPHGHRIVVRRLVPGYERTPEYAGYTHLFTTDCDLDAYDLVLTPTFLREGERSGRAVQIFHGMSDKPFTYERDFSDYLLCLCAGQRQVDRLLAHPRNRRINFAIIGYPKFDSFAAEPALFANGKKTLIYCPTWRKGDLSSVHRFARDPEAIAQIAHDYNLIIKPHPNLFNPDRDHYDPGIVERLESIPGVKLVRSGNVMPWFAQADLYVGDVSASGYEWLYFNRPMVFLNPQPDALQRNSDVEAMTYLWQCGEVCMHVGELQPAIARALGEDRYRKTREALLHYSVLEPRDGRATQRGAARIDALLDTHWSFNPPSAMAIG